MPERFRTVRVRLTAAATVVAALVVLLAGLWLVRTVDGSLRDRQKTQDIQRLAELRAELEQGRRPGELEVMVPGRTTYFEVRVDGRQVAATPGYEQLADNSVLLTTEEVQTSSGLVELVAASPEEPIERSVDAVRGGLLAALPAARRGGRRPHLGPRRARPSPGGVHPGRGRVHQRHDARPPGARTRLRG